MPKFNTGVALVYQLTGSIYYLLILEVHFPKQSLCILEAVKDYVPKLAHLSCSMANNVTASGQFLRKIDAFFYFPKLNLTFKEKDHIPRHLIFF